MEIGPVKRIDPVPMIKPAPASPDLSRVFEVEYLGDSGEDEYTSAAGKAARGLEDEEEDPEQDADASEASPDGGGPLPGKVSFFA